MENKYKNDIIEAVNNMEALANYGCSGSHKELKQLKQDYELLMTFIDNRL